LGLRPWMFVSPACGLSEVEGECTKRWKRQAGTID